MSPTQEALALAERYDRQINRMETKSIKIIDRALLEAYRQLERRLRQSWDLIADVPIIRREAMLAQQLAGYLDMARGVDTFSEEIGSLIQMASMIGNESTEKMVDLFDDELAQQMADFADVPIEAMIAQATRATNTFRGWSENFSNEIKSIVTTNLALGIGPAQTARQMRQRLGILQSRAETIARTETIAAFDSASQQRYEDAGLYSQVFSAGDKRVCEYCAYRNGRVYKTQDIKLPWHPRDRCYRVPWSNRWQKMGLTDDAFAKQYHDEGLAFLASQGKRPNSGLVPFEQKVRTNAPKAVWSPSQYSHTRKFKG